jgi:hypothetical protein
MTAAEGARNAVALIVGHDEQHVVRALGGTTRGGHHGFESPALFFITPLNGIGGGGSCFPSSVTVALGDPGSPEICCAIAGAELSRATASSI